MAFRLVNRDKLLAPGKCTICEQKPRERCVDTGYNNMRNTVNEVLRGRRYVCEACGEKIGKALGMLDPRQAGNMKDTITALENRIVELQEAARLSEQIDRLRAYLTAADSIEPHLIDGTEVTIEVVDDAVAEVPES
jgi:hypothetical protein